MFRARLARSFGVCLLLAGLAPLVYVAALLVWQYSTRVDAGTWPALPASLAFADHQVLQHTKLGPVVPLLPDLPPAWLTSTQQWNWLLDYVHIGVVPALLGLLFIWWGVKMIVRQTAVLRIEKRLKDDRKRRVRLRQYGETERVEPFIGPGFSAGNEQQPGRKAA